MSVRRIGVIASFTLAASVAAFAQSGSSTPTSQTPSSSSAQSPATGAVANDTTTPMRVVGCLMRETDYRRAHHLQALTNVGLGDEFVLVDATVSSPSDTTSASSPTASASPKTPSSSSSARCSESGTGSAYRLTGKLEDQMKPFVGRRMEVTGHFDHERDAKTAAGQTDAKLPAEIAVASYREAPALSDRAATSPAPAPASQQARAETPAPTATTGTSTPTSTTPTRLPRTASHEPLVATIGLLFLTLAAGLHLVRRVTL